MSDHASAFHVHPKKKKHQKTKNCLPCTKETVLTLSLSLSLYIYIYITLIHMPIDLIFLYFYFYFFSSVHRSYIGYIRHKIPNSQQASWHAKYCWLCYYWVFSLWYSKILPDKEPGKEVGFQKCCTNCTGSCKRVRQIPIPLQFSYIPLMFQLALIKYYLGFISLRKTFSQTFSHNCLHVMWWLVICYLIKTMWMFNSPEREKSSITHVFCHNLHISWSGDIGLLFTKYQ